MVKKRKEKLQNKNNLPYKDRVASIIFKCEQHCVCLYPVGAELDLTGLILIQYESAKNL